MTTTGYGADAPWSTPVMNLLMVTMQVTGVGIGLLTLRILVIPLFEGTPLNLDDRLSIKNNHVVVAEYQRDTEVLLDELEELSVDYVLLESDQEEAKRLSDDGYQAINGDPEERSDLKRASIEKASVLITDAGDSTASIVLMALEANEDLRVISFTASTRRKAALDEIGVDRNVAPNVLIGRRLAEKATTPVAVDIPSGRDAITIREILVRRDSPLHGVRVRDSPLVSHPNLTLIAGWFDGELRLPPSFDD
jgi:voltage-gated potassium channel